MHAYMHATFAAAYVTHTHLTRPASFAQLILPLLSVPVLASVQGVSPATALPPWELGAALVCAECGKLGATVLMLRAELAPAGLLQSAAPWFRYQPKKKIRKQSMSAAEAGASLPGQVATGAGFGMVASAAARLADALADGGGGGPFDGGGGEGATGILELLTAPGAGGGGGGGSVAGVLSDYVPVLALATSSLAVAPILEELFFRGYVLPAAARRLPLPAAVAAASALFAAAHFSGRDAPAGCVYLLHVFSRLQMGFIVLFVSSVNRAFRARAYSYTHARANSLQKHRVSWFPLRFYLLVFLRLLPPTGKLFYFSFFFFFKPVPYSCGADSSLQGLFAAGCAFGAAAAATGGGLVAPTVAHATYNAGVLVEAALAR